MKKLFNFRLLVLIGVLITSINSAWAWYVRCSDDSWTAREMTQCSSNTNLYYYPVSGSKTFKITPSNNNWDNAKNTYDNTYGYIISLNNDGYPDYNVTGGSTGENWYICYDSYNNKIYGVFSMNVTGDNWGDPAIGTWSTTGFEMDYDGNNTFTQTIYSVAASEHKFKITRCSSASSNWDNAVGYSNKVSGINCTKAPEDGDGSNIKFTPYAAGDVTITYNKSTGNITIACTAPTITFDKEGGDGGTSSQSTPYGTTTSSISTPSKTGHDFKGYWTGDDGTGTKVIDENGAWIQNITNYTSDESPCKWQITSNGTLHAKWTPSVYNVDYKDQGDVTYSGSNYASLPKAYTYGTGIATLTSGTKTGYNFGGWFDEKTCSGSAITTISTTATGDKVFYAIWTANEYTLTFYKNGEAWSDAAAATTKTRKIVYDQAYSTSYGSQGAIPSMAQKNGWRFDGWFTASSSGTQLIEADGTWKSDIDGILDGSSHWVKANNQDLYAQYSAGTITDIDFYLQSDWNTEVSSVPGDAHMGAVADFGVTPDGSGGTNYIVSWQLQYNDGTPLASQPDFSYDELVDAYKKVKFDAPSSSGTYKLVASLRTGSDRSAGTVVNTATFTFIVASQHTVTVQYKDGSNNTLRSSGSVTVPAAGTVDITAPDNIVGFSFHHWVIGDGVTCTSGTVGDAETQGTADITISAIYDGSVTAVYNKKNMIYFNNTLGWETVWVYFYSSDKYWADDWGTGAWKGQYFNSCCRPYWDMYHSEMTQIEGTNIWYFDYAAKGWSLDSWTNVAFTNMGDQSGYNPDNEGEQAPDNDHAYFSNTTADPIQVIVRPDRSTARSMFVPLTGQSQTLKNNSKANYVSQGYWMNYPENTGYELKIYNKKANDGTDPTLIRTVPFTFSEDFAMPMSVTVDLEANRTYGFKILRNDNTWYGNGGTMKNGSSGDGEQTVWSFRTSYTSNCGLTTSGAGDYTFTLSFGYDTESPAGYNYHVGVHYPVQLGDYRILYKDNAKWSWQSMAHPSAWCHASSIIPKNASTTETKDDIVSLYVAGSTYSPSAKFQYVSGINAETGAVTWTDVTGGTISLSSITKAGVYNFNVRQTASGASISLINTEAYTGNYYIRTDCAGGGKWDNFRGDINHQMTYSDYADKQSTLPADTGFTHYYAHWVDQNTNVKFCIANDYSQCISDTLVGDSAGVYATINSEGKMTSDGASIRFMWNARTNRLKRTYLSGSSVISDRFLVLEGDNKMYDENGDAFSIYGLNPNEANMIDDQNFVYERTIQVNTRARAKLTAKYNNKVQYFKGSAGDFAEGTTVELLGGDAGGKHTMRIIYDFKTDRLVTAYVPSSEITSEIEIHADLMIVRNHQEAGQQLTFSDEEAALTDVKTVYGVMQFNRWTLNNRDGADDPSKDHCDSDGDIATYHGPLDPADQKSAYERGLYWISFPFDVNLSDVFGFGTYGEDWIIMYYDGAKRAQEGYWADSEGFWTYVMPSQRASFKLEKGMGYVLALDLDRMLYNNTSFWANYISQVELFFPSTANVSTILATDVDVNVPAHTCEIGPRFSGGDDRTKKDSHWNVIGVPSYANYGTTLLDVAEGGGTTTINWQTSASSNDIPYLYEWQMYDNSYIVRSGTSYEFQSMHSYMVQYHGTMRWQLASATPPSVAARLTETPDVEYMLSLIQDSIEEDRTYVRMTDKEGVTIGFEFKDDLCKEYNGGRANIWTVTTDSVEVAGNSQPHPLTTTIVPVGVKIAANGEYTFSMPEGTNGGDVWLIDNVNSSRTNLGLMDYTVNLTTGTYEGRFSLEFPVQNVVTEIENAANANANANADVRKVLVGGRLYILRDGKAYDATGAQVR